MYFAGVQNMYKAENALLRIKDWTGNVQMTSNVQEKEGFIYVILEE